MPLPWQLLHHYEPRHLQIPHQMPCRDPRYQIIGLAKALPTIEGQGESERVA
jgi:hypothetical protein